MNIDFTFASDTLIVTPPGETEACFVPVRRGTGLPPISKTGSVSPFHLTVARSSAWPSTPKV